MKHITDRDKFYSGCYGRASIIFYPFNIDGNKGIACGLGNLQKLSDGEPLTGRSSAEDDFKAEDDYVQLGDLYIQQGLLFREAGNEEAALESFNKAIKYEFSEVLLFL